MTKLVVAICIIVFCLGLLFGDLFLSSEETVVVTKTQTQTDTVEVEVVNTEACDLLFNWYVNSSEKAFSTETDLMFQEYSEVCS